MRFDARTAKQLSPGAHLKIDGCPGLRLEATTLRRSWIYRYKSPVDGRMRQIKIGEWPALSIAAAAVEWERLKQARNAGNDPALAKRQANDSVGVMVQQGDSPTVRDICSAFRCGSAAAVVAAALFGDAAWRCFFVTFVLPASFVFDMPATIRSSARSAPCRRICSITSVPEMEPSQTNW